MVGYLCCPPTVLHQQHCGLQRNMKSVLWIRYGQIRVFATEPVCDAPWLPTHASNEVNGRTAAGRKVFQQASDGPCGIASEKDAPIFAIDLEFDCRREDACAARVGEDTGEFEVPIFVGALAYLKRQGLDYDRWLCGSCWRIR